MAARERADIEVQDDELPVAARDATDRSRCCRSTEAAAHGPGADDHLMPNSRPLSEQGSTASPPSRRPGLENRGLKVRVLPVVCGCVLLMILFVLVLAEVLAWWFSTHTWKWPGAGG